VRGDRQASAMRSALLFMIRVYQRLVSPHKDFSCAYRVHTGRASCSVLGYRAVRRHGVFKGLGLIRERTFRCGVAHRRYHGRCKLHAAPLAQRGICDAGCDLPCDVPSCELPSGDLPCGRTIKDAALETCDCLSNCGSCDGGSGRRERKRRAQQRDVHIPPRVVRRG
jgi:putative component of membrane protein insertase Oxa1/YidC/SpoIIIJ protein YidD